MNTKIKYEITDEVLPSLQGVIPSSVVSCSAGGIPNNIAMSQVFYVDKKHVAVSHQFLRKTLQNIKENPVMCVIITCPLEYKLRKLLLRFKESQYNGEVFETMKMQLEIIAIRQRKEELFSLKSADVYELLSIETLDE